MEKVIQTSNPPAAGCSDEEPSRTIASPTLMCFSPPLFGALRQKNLSGRGSLSSWRCRCFPAEDSRCWSWYLSRRCQGCMSTGHTSPPPPHLIFVANATNGVSVKILKWEEFFFFPYLKRKEPLWNLVISHIMCDFTQMSIFSSCV